MRDSFLVLIVSLFFLNVNSQVLTLMTYNIRLDVESDRENKWSNRKDFLVSQIKFYEPEIFGIQEGLPHQVKFINKQLPKYGFVGEGREGGDQGEYSAIFYNEDKYSIEKYGTFWLSKTPQKKSIGWDANLPRICTYALFKSKISEIKFWVFNTHFDHVGKKARAKSTRLILKKIHQFCSKNEPVILMGDLNAQPKSNPINILSLEMNDSKEVATQQPFGPDGTYNSFQYLKTPTTRIDYIFVDKEHIEVKKYGVLNNSYNFKYPSDHFPVYVELALNDKSKKIEKHN